MALHKYLLAAACCASVTLFGADDKVFDVPLLKDVVIDGKADDWGAKGLKVEGLTDGSGKKQTAPNFDVSFRLGWNEKGMLIVATVTDDAPVEPAEKPEDLWKGDSIEIFMAEKKGGETSYQVVISPGRQAGKELRTNLSDYRKDKKGKLTIEAKSTTSDKGYVIEALLPWTNLRLEPSANSEVGLQFFANDVDKESGERYQALWFPKPDIHGDKNNMQRVRLVEEAAAQAAPAPAAPKAEPATAKAPEAPAAATAAGGAQITPAAGANAKAKITEATLDEDGKGRLVLTGDASLKGKSIKVKDGEKQVGKGKFESDGGGVQAKISLNKPKEKTYGTLTVQIDDEDFATVKLK
ncbi:MAG TPA: sugar-binding protein [Planctomycetota bacterium]|nr:sugar-binding protein [Planctomycetota bacterium]